MKIVRSSRLILEIISIFIIHCRLNKTFFLFFLILKVFYSFNVKNILIIFLFFIEYA